MIQKKRKLNPSYYPSISKIKHSKYFPIFNDITTRLNLAIPFKTKYNPKKSKYTYEGEQKQKFHIQQKKMSITLRSSMNMNSIRNLTELKHMKTEESENINEQYTDQNILIHKVRLTQLYRIGNFSKVYKAMINNPINVEVVVKKIVIDPQHKNREEYFARILKNPYIVNYLGTYYSKQSQIRKETKIHKMLKDRYQLINENNEKREVEYLNIVMQKYGNNLNQIIQLECLSAERIKIYLYQMLRSLLYIHSLDICHRDIKPHNFVIKNNRIFLCDFGAAKVLSTQGKSVSYIFSREYRAPELLFECQNYDTSVDMWAMGCVAAQIILKKPLFNGLNNLDQLVKILRIFGTPRWEFISFCKDKVPHIPHIQGTGLKEIFDQKFDGQLVNLVQKMLKIEPKQRITAVQALCDPYFDQIRDQSFYRAHLRSSNLPNFFYFTKRQLQGNQQFASKLIPYWLKQHCKRFQVNIKDYNF